MSANCPQCGQRLQQQGEMEAGRQRLRLYECDRCVMVFKAGSDKPVTIPLMFAVNVQGQTVSLAQVCKAMDEF